MAFLPDSEYNPKSLVWLHKAWHTPFRHPTSRYHSHLLAGHSPFADFDPDRFASLLLLKHVKHMPALGSLYSLPGLSGKEKKKKKSSSYYNHLASFIWLGLNFSPNITSWEISSMIIASDIIIPFTLNTFILPYSTLEHLLPSLMLHIYYVSLLTRILSWQVQGFLSIVSSLLYVQNLQQDLAHSE